jgi:hypothetical protein
MAKGPTKGKADRHWTHRVETLKVYIFLLQILAVVLYVVMTILRDIGSLEQGYIDLPAVLVPLALLVVVLGFEGLAVYAVLCAYRPDPAERIRDHAIAGRAALGTAIASIVVFAILVAPPVHDAISDLAGGDVSETRDTFLRTLDTRDILNVTEPKGLALATAGDVPFDIRLYRGDSVSTGVLVEETFNVTAWRHDFGSDDVSEYTLMASANATTSAVPWRLTVERALRPSIMMGVAIPFLSLGIANVVWWPVARWRGARLKERYAETQRKRLRARFKVEEAFLIYEDGRLIAHNSRRLKPERDKDITTGMLTAVQSFVTDTLMDEEKGTLDQLKYGSLSILVEAQGKTNLAVIISGEETPVLREGMRNVLDYVNKRYRLFLEDWDGDIDRFRDVKRFIGHLVSTGREEPAVPDEAFLIHRDGRLVTHQTSRLEPSVDDALLLSWVGECLEAVRAAMDDPGAPMVSHVTVAGQPVVVEYNSYLAIAYMGARGDTDEMRDHMGEILSDIDNKFRRLLYEWDGSTAELTDLKLMLEVVFTPGAK